LVGSLSTLFTLFTGFYTSQVVGNGISEPSTVSTGKSPKKKSFIDVTLISGIASIKEIDHQRSSPMETANLQENPTRSTPATQDAIVAKKVDMYRHGFCDPGGHCHPGI